MTQSFLNSQTTRHRIVLVNFPYLLVLGFTGSADGALKIWNLRTAREIESFELPTTGNHPFVVPQVPSHYFSVLERIRKFSCCGLRCLLHPNFYRQYFGWSFATKHAGWFLTPTRGCGFMTLKLVWFYTTWRYQELMRSKTTITISVNIFF